MFSISLSFDIRLDGPISPSHLPGLTQDLHLWQVQARFVAMAVTAILLIGIIFWIWRGHVVKSCSYKPPTLRVRRYSDTKSTPSHANGALAVPSLATALAPSEPSSTTSQPVLNSLAFSQGSHENPNDPEPDRVYKDLVVYHHSGFQFPIEAL